MNQPTENNPAPLSEADCSRCKGKGTLVGNHRPGFTHYETDAGEPCPEYHFEIIKCPECELRATIAQRDETIRQLQALNEFFRDSIGECHVMISRDSSEYQIRSNWAATDLPPRLQRVMQEHRQLREQIRSLEEDRSYSGAHTSVCPASRLEVDDHRCTCGLTAAKLREQFAQAQVDLAKERETWFDGETTWNRPTAWAHAQACKVINGRQLTAEKERDKAQRELEEKEESRKEWAETCHRLTRELAEHRKAVGAWLSEMYATMVDPLAEGEMKIEETCRILLERAREDRQALFDKDGELAEARAALEPFCDLLEVKTNSGLVHLEIGGVPMCRPIEQVGRDKLGTLFTLLFNAKVIIDAARAAEQKEGK